MEYLTNKIQANLSHNCAGRILNPQNLDNELKEVYEINLHTFQEAIDELVRTISQQPELRYIPSLHFSISDSFRIDAFAAYLDPVDPDLSKHYLINIYYGVFTNFYTLFWGLLANPGILTEITPEKEIPSFKYNKSLLDYCYNFQEASNQMDEFGKTFITHFYPEHHDRRVFSQILSNICIEYIFMHEISHVLGGHIGYLMENATLDGLFHFQPSSLSMAAFHATSGIPNIKLFEFEADVIAGGLMAGLLKHNRTLLGQYLEDEMSYSLDLYKAFAFALLILFHLFQEIRNKYNKEQPYPEPELRFWAAYWGVTSALRNNEGESGVKKFENSFTWAIKEYLQMLEVLQLPGVFPFHKDLDKSAQGELEKLENALQNISPLLEPYSVWRQGNIKTVYF